MVKSRKIHANQLPETGRRYNFQKDELDEPVIELDLSWLEHSIDKIDPEILFELQKDRLATVWTETFTRKEITLKNYIPKVVTRLFHRCCVDSFRYINYRIHDLGNQTIGQKVLV